MGPNLLPLPMSIFVDGYMVNNNNTIAVQDAADADGVEGRERRHTLRRPPRPGLQEGKN